MLIGLWGLKKIDVELSKKTDFGASPVGHLIGAVSAVHSSGHVRAAVRLAGLLGRSGAVAAAALVDSDGAGGFHGGGYATPTAA